MVTDPGDADDLMSGTLYYGLTEDGPLWITFARDMTVRPIHDLLVHSHMHKTVDGRGAAVVAGDGGGCLTIHNVHHPRNHSARLQARAGGERRLVRQRRQHVFRATNVWIDRYTVDYCTDGLIDVMEASTRVTLNHDKAVLLGKNTCSLRTRT
jgi:pectate lyase